jgi:hypothetical protein
VAAHPDQDVLPAGGFERLLACSLDPAVDELKRRPALHRQGRAGVVGEHEHRVVEGRIVSPPAGPHVVTPWSDDDREQAAPRRNRTFR